MPSTYSAATALNSDNSVHMYVLNSKCSCSCLSSTPVKAHQCLGMLHLVVGEGSMMGYMERGLGSGNQYHILYRGVDGEFIFRRLTLEVAIKLI